MRRPVWRPVSGMTATVRKLQYWSHHGTEERSCRGSVPLRRDVHVDDLARTRPPPGARTARYRRRPRMSRRRTNSSRPCAGTDAPLSQQRGEPVHAPVDRHLVNVDAALGEESVDVAIAQPEPQVSAHRQHDHLRWEPGTRRTSNTMPGAAASSCESASIKLASRPRRLHAIPPGPVMLRWSLTVELSAGPQRPPGPRVPPGHRRR
jgi:hypothetical protein